MQQLIFHLRPTDSDIERLDIPSRHNGHTGLSEDLRRLLAQVHFPATNFY